jgi:hypothetical protein
MPTRIEIDRRGADRVAPKLRPGRESFRILVTDIEERRCAVPRERVLAVLEVFVG